MNKSFLDRRLLPHHHAPTQYNKREYFGVEYLYRQAGRQFVISDKSTANDEIRDEVDEGIVKKSTTLLSSSISEYLLTIGVEITEEEEEEEKKEEEEEKDEDQKDEVCSAYI